VGFTFDLTTPAGKARFEIGDTVANSGILPGGANFDDGEVDYALTQSQNNVKAAAAMLASIAAGRWSSLPQSFSVDGLSVNRGDVSARMRDMAVRLSSEAASQGYGAGGGAVNVVSVLNSVDPYTAPSPEEWQ